MPRLTDMPALLRAVSGFHAEPLDVPMEEEALELAARSLEESGLLLVGEIHGVRENPLVALTLMRALGVTRLALEWPPEIAADGPTIVVAGNLHTPTEPHQEGIPMGAHLARARPGLRSIAIEYGKGSFYNCAPRHIDSTAGEGLSVREGRLVFGLPRFTEAEVPHRV
ncbi:hypothetical protein ACIBG8_49505 [Nonomuraea sp. NPDC050556]|uniref:hypothetical protein n=1 Tax=Nonomuraea sp. NPDC050556 TaxID=3364369 RepID=UPI0037A1C4BE